MMLRIQTLRASSLSQGARCRPRSLGVHFLVLLVGGILTLDGTSQDLALAEELPLVFSETFEDGAEKWQPFDETVWRVDRDGDKSVYSQLKKSTSYSPPHRSPLLMALLKNVVVGDLDLRLRVKSTHPDYGHRDVCVIFGYQDPAHFYYVHLGKETDDHANQIFVVDDAPRVKISTETTSGTPWDDEWHEIRIVRNTGTGEITVYFDDMESPVMRANDKRFQWGQIGIGSFDDSSAWDDIQVHGKVVAKTE